MSNPENDGHGMCSRYLLRLSGEALFEAALFGIITAFLGMVGHYLTLAGYVVGIVPAAAAIFTGIIAAKHFRRSRRLRELANQETDT